MNVTIRFFIDEEALTMAVRHCLHFQIEPSFPNVKKVIRNAVLNNGKSIIDFPESWGDDLMYVNQVDVDKALILFKPNSDYIFMLMIHSEIYFNLSFVNFI